MILGSRVTFEDIGKLIHLRLEHNLINSGKREFDLFIKSLLEFLIATKEAHCFTNASSFTEFKVLKGSKISNINGVEGKL